MIDQLVLATNNPRKLIELQRVLEAAGLKVAVRPLADFDAYDEPAEDADDFEGNALIKARAACKRTGLPAVADDSGLEVDAFNRMPGIRSARWAGPGASDADNLELLLRQTSDLPDEKRAARFVCALALVTPEGTERIWRHTMEGRIIAEPRGGNGFGYDPMFVPDGCDVTSAELSADDKDAISHRGKALRAMAEDLAR